MAKKPLPVVGFRFFLTPVGLAASVSAALVRHQAEEQWLDDSKANAVHSPEEGHAKQILRTGRNHQARHRVGLLQSVLVCFHGHARGSLKESLIIVV